MYNDLNLKEFVRRKFPLEKSSCNENGFNILFTSISHSDISMIEYLLNYGFSPDEIDSNGLAPAHIACRRENYKEIQELLIKYKGDKTIKTKQEFIIKGNKKKFSPDIIFPINSTPEEFCKLFNR